MFSQPATSGFEVLYIPITLTPVQSESKVPDQPQASLRTNLGFAHNDSFSVSSAFSITKENYYGISRFINPAIFAGSHEHR